MHIVYATMKDRIFEVIYKKAVFYKIQKVLKYSIYGQMINQKCWNFT